MDKFVSLENYSINEASGKSGYWLNQNDANKLVSSIMKFIDEEIVALKNDILSGKYTPTKRGVFDRLKNWWYNAIMGYENKKNPYYKTNVLGKLGQVAEMRLEDYKFLLFEANKIEVANRQKTNLDKILDAWSFDFKKNLESRLREFLTNVFQEQKPAITVRQEKNVRIPNADVPKSVKINTPKPSKEKAKEEKKEDLSKETEMVPITKEQDELRNLLEKLIAKEEDIFIDNLEKAQLEEEEEQYFYGFENEYMDTLNENPDKYSQVIRLLKDYMNNKSLSNLQTLKSNLSQVLSESTKIEIDTLKNFNLKEKLDFENTTLYERTIECLDKLRGQRL
jgi:hypothetical protein